MEKIRGKLEHNNNIFSLLCKYLESKYFHVFPLNSLMTEVTEVQLFSFYKGSREFRASM